MVEIKSCHEPITLRYVSAINVFNPRLWSRLVSPPKRKLLTVPFDRSFSNRRREYFATNRRDSEDSLPLFLSRNLNSSDVPLSGLDRSVSFEWGSRFSSNGFKLRNHRREETREKSEATEGEESVARRKESDEIRQRRSGSCELASWRDILRWFAPERQVLSAPDAEKRHSVEFLRFDLNLVIPKFAEFTEVWIITGCCADFADATWGLFFARAVCVCVCVEQKGCLEDNGETCSLPPVEEKYIKIGD